MHNIAAPGKAGWYAGQIVMRLAKIRKDVKIKKGLIFRKLDGRLPRSDAVRALDGAIVSGQIEKFLGGLRRFYFGLFSCPRSRLKFEKEVEEFFEKVTRHSRTVVKRDGFLSNHQSGVCEP